MQNNIALRFAFSGMMLCLGLFNARAVFANGPQKQLKQNIVGWTLFVDERLVTDNQVETEHAVSLLQEQLEEIVRVVPAAAVTELKKVPLWFSLEYPGIPPRAEYHPSADWLNENHRNPNMAKGIEFTNIRIFDRETKRMKNFALHELAHAYHDRVLAKGFANETVKAAFEAAKSDGRYDRVEQRFGDGRSQTVRAYAMSNPMEFFAEGSEALFSVNDFFPFTREQLAKHDPPTLAMLNTVWGAPGQLSTLQPASTFSNWKHSASLWIITTASGADLPSNTQVTDFPLLITLHQDTFQFSEAKSNGDDIRFTDSSGTPLHFQIDQWDAEGKTANIWVRVPSIRGNANQEIRMFWGNPDADSASHGQHVFNQSNGYLTVAHMHDVLQDEAGSVTFTDVGTSLTDGRVGTARRFSIGKGIHAGQSISAYPTGSSSHSTEAWFRAEEHNGNIIAWGNEQAQGKVVMQYVSPPRIRMDCYFSNANVRGKLAAPRNEWVHVVHTYESGNTHLYLNGLLDSSNTSQGSPLAIRSPCRLSLGGWYDQYNFVGAIDEVRVSNVARSAEWIKLEYENQKTNQTLVGPPVHPGERFSVSHSKIDIHEGERVTIVAQADGVRKLYWILKRGADAGHESTDTVLATDRFELEFDAGRVTKKETATLVMKAVYENETKTLEIPISIEDTIPEPVFTLVAPATWNGRDTIEIAPSFSNLADLNIGKVSSQNVDRSISESSLNRATSGNQAASDPVDSTSLSVRWSIDDVAVIKDLKDRTLVLKRSQGSGPLKVTATIDNGGSPVSQTVVIHVTEPDSQNEPWIDRLLSDTEQPEDNQFIARSGSNFKNNRTGQLVYAGRLEQKADSVFLRVFADDQLRYQLTSVPTADNRYTLTAKLRAELVKYRTEFGVVTDGVERVLHAANNIVCGDAYLIIGQSNAVATDFGKENPLMPNDWIRTYGSTSGDPTSARSNLWANATARSPGGVSEIGYWGMELGRRIVESEKVPVCLINGAVGGTRIDQHQRNHENPTDVTTIYGRQLWRAQQSKLTHGIRAVIWHQGENDQGADGPTGGYGFETYRQYFVDLAASWKEDYPNIQHYYVFQIWPKSCGMGMEGSDNRLREVQRNLPNLFSNLSVMSTLGVRPPGGCHFPAAGYAEFARLLHPLIQSHIYSVPSDIQLTPPNLIGAYFSSDDRDAITLEFDQAVEWDDKLVNQFHLDNAVVHATSGQAVDNRVELKFASPVTSTKISYIDGERWSPDNILMGRNGIAALTFCDVAIKER